jgi:pSer/pThr/pTyr-binding forkhead associated (FHA) protein
MIIRIGRDSGNDFVVDNMTASRKHAVLEIADGNIVVKDTASKSGTYVIVDGKIQRIRYHNVTEQDIILIGNEKLRVKDIIDHAQRMNQKAVYERDPITGEIIKK